jgi:Domain of unknown function (DUF932)
LLFIFLCFDYSVPAVSGSFFRSLAMSRLATSFGYNANVIRSHLPLTDDQLAFAAPSIFATDKHSSRSKRYTYIPTSSVLSLMRENGFMPFMACQANTRDAHNLEYTKHMIRFRYGEDISVNGEEVKEIILINSHNGACSYQLLAGVYRFCCQNGLVCGEDIADFRVNHAGKIQDRVIASAFEVLDRFPRVNASVNTMKILDLSKEEQKVYAKAALALRYGDIELSPISDDAVLRPRRQADRADDSLWSTFNIVQENVTRGGIRGRNTKRNLVRTRPINGIDANIKFNRALWSLTEKAASFKLLH